MKIFAQINRMISSADTQVKAIASVSLDGMFAVHGIRVINSEKGRFVNMPSNSYTDRNGETKYSDTFHPITKEAREAINRAVLQAYDQQLLHTQATAIEVMPQTEDQQEGPDLFEQSDEVPDIAM